jgi:hypothetical protein
MDLLGLVFGFWMFIFSKMFREAWIHDYRKSNPLFKFFHALESLVAVAIGLGIPIFFIYLLIGSE